MCLCQIALLPAESVAIQRGTELVSQMSGSVLVVCHMHWFESRTCSKASGREIRIHAVVHVRGCYFSRKSSGLQRQSWKSRRESKNSGKSYGICLSWKICTIPAIVNYYYLLLLYLFGGRITV